MDYSLHNIFWLVLIAGALTVQGISKTSRREAIDESDYSNDDNYQNDEDDSNDEGEYKGPPAMITTNRLNLTVMEGNDVFLPCDILNGEHFTVMWKNGTKTLWIANTRIQTDSRLHKFSNNTVLLRQANMYDSGSYTCQVVAEKIVEVTHTLNVVRRLSIVKFLPEVRPGQSKILRKGDSLTLACEVTGFPVPKVYWVRRGRKHFPNGHERMEGTSITFEEVNRKYSGIYDCEASNEFGTVRKSVEIHVHYPPEIEIEEETVTTAIGLQPEITCTVHAEPKANVTWYKNGDIVTKKNRISTTVVNNKYTLQITKMNEDDFGSYTCHARNELGSKQKAIVLSGAPTKPKFKLGTASDQKSPEITWTVESYSPITEYEFQYKRVQNVTASNVLLPRVNEALHTTALHKLTNRVYFGSPTVRIKWYRKDGNVLAVFSEDTASRQIDEKWIKMTPTTTITAEGNIYTGKEVLSGLPPNDYQVRVRAKNSHGWSFYSEEQVFNGEMAAESTSGAVNIQVKTLVQILPLFYVLFM